MDESADESSAQEEPFTFSLEEHDTDTSHESSPRHVSVESDAEKSVESIDENSFSQEVDQTAGELTSNISVKPESDETCSDLVNDNAVGDELESSDQVLKEEEEEAEAEAEAEAEEEEQSEPELTDQKFPEEEEEEEQSEFELEDRPNESELFEQRLKEEQEKFNESESMDHEQVGKREKPSRWEPVNQELKKNQEKQFEQEIMDQKRKEREDATISEQEFTSQIPHVEEMSLKDVKDPKKELFINLVDLNTSKSDNEDTCNENVPTGDSKNEGNLDDSATSDTPIEKDSLHNEAMKSSDLIDQCKKFVEENTPVTDVNAETIPIIRSKILDNVNTDLPNTELSNVDISSLDMEPTEAYESIHSDQPQTNLLDDLLDDLSDDFVGFDAEIINETMQKIRILREKQEEMIQLRQVKAEKEKADIEGKDVSNPFVADIQLETTSSIQHPPISSSRSSINYVYQLTRDKNIFEEQVPSGSKRVKKKRTLYGDFIEPESGSTTKKPSMTKEIESCSKKDISCENKENLVTEEKAKETVVTESDSALTAAIATPPVSKIPIKPKRSSLFDISKPLYKEPFKYGWKREISYRDLSESSKNTKSAYVAYFDPNGKKMKSLRQIAEKLPPGGALSINNFTFSKERIFTDDDSNNFELIRRLKNVNKDFSETEIVTKHRIAEMSYSNTPVSEEQLKTSFKKKSSSSRPKSLTAVSNTDSENRVIAPSSKSKSSKKKKVEVNDGDTNDTPSAPASKVTMPRILIRNANSNSSKPVGVKSKVPSSKSSSQIKAKKSSKKPLEKNEKQEPMEKSNLQLNATTSEHGDESQIQENLSETLEYNGYSPSTHHQKEESRGMPACSISCPLAMGFPPTLQCTLCLSFYHSKCCEYDTNDQLMHNFVCKNCRQMDRNIESQNSSEYLLAVSESSNSVCLVGSGNKADLSALPAKSAPKIVDGVTTWLPSSSNIQLSSSKTEWNRLNSTALHSENQSSLLQSVLELDGKRYIIVPKESIVSISPNVNTTINTFDEFKKGRLVGERDSVSSARRTSPTNLLSAASIPNILLNNLLNVTSSDPASSSPMSRLSDTAGVDGAAIDFPHYCSSDNRNHIGNSRIKANVLGIARSLKRKHWEESDPSTFSAKKARTDANKIHSLAYHSPLTLSNIALMHSPLTLCFKYLTVKELLRVSMTCKYLNCVASDSSLWKIVRLKNSKITNWEGFAKALQKHGTRRLDMRKMLCPTSAEDLDTMWEHFFRVIPSVKSLERIDFMRCSSDVVHTVAQTCPYLKVINALQLKSSEISLGKFTNSSCLKELRLKGFPGVNLEANVHKLKFNSSSLQILSLTNMKNLNMDALNAIRTLENLRVLELGECESLTKDFTDILISFKKLERLRLEKVVNLDPDYKLFAILKHLKHFKTLELINIEVKVGFDKALKACQNLEEFLLIPLYRKESATANKLIVDGIQTLSKGLKKFVWGLTTELLEITNIFLQEYHGSKLRDTEGSSNNSINANNGAKVMPKKGNADADSIPITKKSSEKADKVEVDIVPIWQLEMQLGTSLPHTKVKVLRIPFNSTGRQSLSDSFK